MKPVNEVKASKQCPICSGLESELVLTVEDGHTLLRCLKCGVLFVYPQPVQDRLTEAYSAGEAISVDLHGQLTLTPKKLLIARDDLRLIQRVLPSGRLFEVGCGAGYFLWYVKQHGYEAAGNEVNHTLVEFAREHLQLNVFEGDLLQIEIEGGWDVVYMRNVLSHLPDPLATLQKVHQLLRPGGWVFIETGNVAELSTKQIHILHRLGRLGVPDHLFFFTRAGLRSLMEQLGFKRVAERCYGVWLHDWLMAKVEKRARAAFQANRVAKSHSNSLKARIVGYASYFLAYPVGRLLPAAGRKCSVKYLFQKV
ncbi:MAG: class I SAM-dependent methyltransferase [Thermofilaceae archaeon]